MSVASRVRLFLFNDTATTEIYTLSRHDALPISGDGEAPGAGAQAGVQADPHVDEALDGQGDDGVERLLQQGEDRKSTRLNSSHANISYAVVCLKKTRDSSADLTVMVHVGTSEPR